MSIYYGFKDSVSKFIIHVCGFRYMAPEYASSGKLTERSDVFSFGVMLLELITGHQPVDLTGEFMEDSLVEWVGVLNVPFPRSATS